MRKAIKVATEASESAARDLKAFCVVQLDVGLDSAALREAVAHIMEKKEIAVLMLTTDETTDKAVFCAGVPEWFKQLDVTEWCTVLSGPLKGICGKAKGGLASGPVLSLSQVRESISSVRRFVNGIFLRRFFYVSLVASSVALSRFVGKSRQMTSSSGTRFPLAKKDYDLLEEVGDGVHRARCIPLDEIVAIKICNLEKGLNDVETLRKESDYTDHPNILKAYCYFKVDSSLWTVMPYMSCGSCLNIMKSVYPEGLEEPVVATLLREILKALVYLHGQSYIHRDVKAGNILVDSNGTVKLGDFGISEYIFSRLHKLRTNSGTPYWMPPEDMQEFYSYDSSEDIWSFGITALELAHGPAPFLKYPPMKVLQMTLENAYSIFYKPEKIKLSKSFRELVASCLVKDPKKRPTAEKLLKYPFFRHSSNIHLSITFLDGLSPLGQRYKKLKDEDAKYHGTKEQLSLQKYIDDIKDWPHFKYQIPKDELETFQSSEEEKELSEEEKELSEEEQELSEEEKELSEEE